MRKTQLPSVALLVGILAFGAALFPFAVSAASIEEYTQCANYLGSGYETAPTGCRWINGNLVASNSLFYEGESTVQRLLITGLTPGIHTIALNYGTTKAGKHAYDFLTDDTFSETWITTEEFCEGLVAIPSCTSLPVNLSPLIAADPNANGFDAQILARRFKIRNGTFVSVTPPTVVNGTYAADSETRVALTIDVPNTCADMSNGTCPVLITWGMHVSKQSDWGIGNSAGAISGSPYHISIIWIDGVRVGSRDNQMSASAVKAMIISTEPPTALTDIDTILNGFANPNGTPAIGWFRYSLTNPGTCDDTFGTRVPETGGTDLGSGTKDVPYSETVYGLLGGTTYYFCAIGMNGAGMVFGNIVSFVTPSYPDLVIFQNPSLYSGILVAGGAVSFKGVVGNTGSAAIASPFSAHFHVDVNNDGDVTNDIDLAPDFTVPSLAVGAGTQVVSGLWSNLPIGTHRVILCADQPPLPGGVIVEPYEDNNCSEVGTGVVTVTYPDLVIFQNPSLYSGILVAGGAVSFKGVVGNTGSAAIASPFSAHFHVDVNNDGDVTNDIDLAPDFTVPSLAVGAGTQVVSGLWSNLPIGTHRVILCADQPPLPGGVIVEPYEDNNCSEVGTGVVTVTPPPVLTITPLFRDFGSIVVGNSVDKSFLLTNTGGGRIINGTFALPAWPFSCAEVNGPAQCDFTLGAGESVVKWITYSPTSLTESNIFVNVTSNVPPQRVQLYGAGIPAITGTGLEFGKVTVGKWKDLILTITNRGGTPVQGVLRVPEPFSCIVGNVPSACVYDIPAFGGTNTFIIRFTPPTVGEFLDNAELLAPPFNTFPLSGEGYRPFIRFREI